MDHLYAYGAAIAVFSLLSTWAGAIIGAYLAEKGKNLAIKDDMEEMTTRLKRLENKLADERLLSSAFVDRKIRSYMKLHDFAAQALKSSIQKHVDFQSGQASWHDVAQSVQPVLDHFRDALIDEGLFMSNDVFDACEAFLQSLSEFCLSTVRPNMAALEPALHAMHDAATAVKTTIHKELSGQDIA